MARKAKPKEWVIKDVDYRTRYTFYRMLASLSTKGRDLNATKTWTSAIDAIRCGQDELLPASELNATFVEKLAEALRLAGASPDMVTMLARSLQATPNDIGLVDIEISRTDASTALLMFDEFLKDPSGAIELGRMDRVQHVMWFVEALEAVKTGVDDPGNVEPIKKQMEEVPALPPPDVKAASGNGNGA